MIRFFGMDQSAATWSTEIEVFHIATFALILLLFHTAIYLSAAVIAIWLQRRQERWQPGSRQPVGGVSVILPIKGLDPGAEEHYRRWLSQDLAAPHEVIFSLQDSADPVLPILERLIRTHPRTAARILINPIAPGLNGKSSNLMHGVEAARYDDLVMADSDILPPADLLSRMVPPLADPRVGEVACLPVARGAANLPGGMIAMLLNLAMVVEWGMQELRGDVKVASGACFAIRRQTLASIGGIAAFGGYVAEDAEMARRLWAAGLRIVMGPAVTLEQGNGSWTALLGLQARAAMLTLRIQSWPEAMKTLIGLFVPFVVLVPALALGHWPLAGWVLGTTVLRMGAMALLQYWSDPGSKLRFLWAYPLIELTNLLMFVVAPVTNRLAWRGVIYRVEKGGRLTVVQPPGPR